MPTPREVLSRREQSAAASVPASIVPAPVAPVPVAPVPIIPAAPVQSERPARVVVPQPIRSQSVYRQLMASHDRMHTRHLGG